MEPIYLKEERERQGLTQEELAAKAGVRQSVISRLEREPSVKVSFVYGVKLAYALGVDPRALRFGPRSSEAMAS